MSTTTQIILVAVIGVMLICLTMFPGVFPLRVFEPIFSTVCVKVINGDVKKYNQTDFQGVSGLPIRRDYIVCGIDPAYDADEICYVAPQAESLTGDFIPESEDDCDMCQYSWDYVKGSGKILGKSCRPYRFIWKWEYKTPF